MKMLVIVLALSLIGTAVTAQTGPDNLLGIYFDEAATSTYYGTPYSAFDYYLIVSNPTMDVILGFALDLFVQDMAFDGFAGGFGMDSFPDGVLGTITSNGFFMAVGLANPGMTTGPTTILLHTSGFYGGSGNLCWFILPTSMGPPSEIGRILLLDGNGVTQDAVANVSPDHGAAAWVGDGTVATEELTFGGVKALYR